MNDLKDFRLIDNPTEIFKKVPKSFPPLWMLFLFSTVSLIVSIFLGLVLLEIIQLPGVLTSQSGGMADLPLEQGVGDSEDQSEEVDIIDDPCVQCVGEEYYYLDVDFPVEVFSTKDTQIPILATFSKNGQPVVGEQISIKIADSSLPLLVDIHSGDLTAVTDKEGSVKFTLPVKEFVPGIREVSLDMSVQTSTISKSLMIRVIAAQVLYDKDMDGLSDEKELELGTSPNNVDSDYDQYTDFDEVYSYRSDPLISNSYVVNLDKLEYRDYDDSQTVLGDLTYLTPVFYIANSTSDYSWIFVDLLASKKDMSTDPNGQLILLKEAELVLPTHAYVAYRALADTPVTILSEVDDQHSLVRLLGQVANTEETPTLRIATQCTAKEIVVLEQDSDILVNGINQGQNLRLQIQGDCGVGEWKYMIQDVFGEASAVLLKKNASSPEPIEVIVDTSKLSVGKHIFRLIVTSDQFPEIISEASQEISVTVNQALESQATQSEPSPPPGIKVVPDG